MRKFKNVVSLLLCTLMLISMIPVMAVSAQTEDHTVSAAASQLRRMWSQQNYNSNDYVYGNDLLFWGRVLYVRFLDTSGADAASVEQAVIRFEARTREPGEVIRAAALSMSDEHALAHAESNLTSPTHTLRYFYNTENGQGGAKSKMMIDTNGRYLSAVSDKVVAYDEFTASTTAVTDDSVWVDESRELEYKYPVTVELDVTDAFRAAKEKGNNAQFIIMLPKDVFVDGTNVGRSTDFGGYRNGTLYDVQGKVVKSNVASASLDTSKSVCGNAGYYTPNTKADDDYFYWIFPLQETIELEIKTRPLQERYEEIREEISLPSELSAGLRPLHQKFTQWDLYQKLLDNNALAQTLLQKLQECTLVEDFVAAFDAAVEQAYWQGYTLRLNVDTSFGGAKGTLELEGEDIPNFCYIQLDAYTASKKQFSQSIVMKGGYAEYNIYDRKDGIVELKLRATADEAGETVIAGEQTVAVDNVLLPGVFITELSNRHTITYYPDTSAGANRGQHEQKFQYIELYNYSDTAVDLSEHTFVYNDHKGSHAFEWKLEENGSLMLEPGEIYVIGVYSADSAKAGYGFATDAQKNTYWDAFNSFYNSDIPVTNRVMIACVASGNAEVMLDGVDRLVRSADAKVTCSAQIKKGNAVVTEVSLYENRPGDSIAFQFVPSDNGGVAEEFLFTTGCYPGALLKEQQLGYCEEAFLNGTPMLRVSSYNILATEKSASDNYTGLEIEQREDLFVKYMQDYDVDIVGMQEVNYRWAPLLMADMPKIGYSEVQGISTNGRTYSNASGIWDLLNPIYYKADKFKELERGHGFLTPSFPNNAVQWDSDNMRRTVTWVVLENKQTGEVVSFLNTHLVLSGKQARVEQVRLMYKKGEELQKKYGGSIIITGDHNMVENSEPYQTYINGGVVVDSKYETTNHNSISTCANGNVANDEVYAPTIDYVMVSKNYIVNKYYVHNGIVENGHLSDHAGLYVELYNSAYKDTDVPVITGVEDGKTYCQSATFTASDENLASVTLNGEEITNPRNYKVLSVGDYTLKVTDVAGREVTVRFSIQAHTYEWEWNPPQTCIAAGKYVGTCTSCKETISYNRPATGIHQKIEGDEGTVVKAPTCKEAGIRRFKCKECQSNIDESIDKLTEHVWKSDYTVDQKATCKAAGSKSIHCQTCDAIKEGSSVAIPKLTTHTAGKWKTVKAATTSATGLKEQRCSVCDILLDSEVIPKKQETKPTPSVNFTDVKKSDYYYDAVAWAVALGVTTGTSPTTFGPNASCTRAQAVTFLWRAAGSPAPKGSKNPFTDVKKSDYFYKAVLWAAENNVTSGMTPTTFGPNASCTRGQIVTFLWRAQGGKKVSAANPFKDVKKSDYYYDAVLWAVKNDVTTGTAADKFSPNATCTRGQIVTFLYRAVA